MDLMFVGKNLGASEFRGVVSDTLFEVLLDDNSVQYIAAITSLLDEWEEALHKKIERLELQSNHPSLTAKPPADRGKTCDTLFSGALHDYPVGSGQEKQKTGNRKYTLGTLKQITDQTRREHACCYAIQDH
ncbi:hypothetical protein [Paenibacillus medicaginis]|uniref:Uncharacterized protein n=1 Tax=Paenibacillus medicaginis TaxID=1470560 RepID=A0ABV5C6W2_9BACL